MEERLAPAMPDPSPELVEDPAPAPAPAQVDVDSLITETLAEGVKGGSSGGTLEKKAYGTGEDAAGSANRSPNGQDSGLSGGVTEIISDMVNQHEAGADLSLASFEAGEEADKNNALPELRTEGWSGNGEEDGEVASTPTMVVNNRSSAALTQPLARPGSDWEMDLDEGQSGGQVHTKLEDDADSPERPVRGMNMEEVSSQDTLEENIVHSKDVQELCKNSIHACARHGDVKNLQRLLGTHSPDEGDNVGFTPLHFAACYGHERALKALLDADADVDAANEHGWIPLHVAARNGHLGCVNLLLEAGSKVETEDKTKWTALHNAGCGTSLPVVDTLLASGAVINVQDHEGWSPLHLAARFNNVEVLSLLLQYGANPDLQDVDGWTATHNSTRNGRQKCVKLLVDHGADLQLKTRYGETSMHIASRKGKAKVVSILVKEAERRGVLAKILQITDIDGRTPELVASNDHIRSILRKENENSIYDVKEDVLLRSASAKHIVQTIQGKARTCTIL